MKTLDRGLEPPDREVDNDAEDVLSWVAKTYLPEFVFSYAQLEDWALRNNWILPDNNNTTKNY